MNVRTSSFLLWAGRAGLMLTLAGSPVAVGAAQPATPSLTSTAIAKAEKNAPYPTFASVPKAPKDVRSLQAWKTAILAVRNSGDALAIEALHQRWTLSNTDAFAAQARAEATPPPPVTLASDPDTDAQVAEMRARAKEPPRSH